MYGDTGFGYRGRHLDGRMITTLVVSRLLSKNNRNKEKDMEHLKGHLAMNTPPIVSPQEWEAARQQLLVKEGLDPRP
jgi:hypothetical protein